MNNTIKKILHITSFVIVIAVFASVGFYSFFDKDEKMSEAENRNLAQKPEFSLSSYISGDFASNFEEYYNDQFPGRNTLVKISNKIKAFYSCFRMGDGATVIQGQGGIGEGEALVKPTDESEKSEETSAVETTSGNTQSSAEKPTSAVGVKDEGKETVYSSDYIIILDHRAMEMYTNSYKKIDAYVETLNKLKKTLPDTKVYCLLAPTSIEFYAPKKYNEGKSKSQYQGITYAYSKLNDITTVDAYREIAEHTDEYLYFRTDHHWTARGSYYAYIAFSKVAGFEPVNINSLKSGVLKPFLGSLYRTTQSADLEKNPDYLEYFIPAAKTSAIAAADAEMKNNYQIEVINTDITSSNKYLAFIEGDNPVTKITTDVQNNKSVLVIKESYGNAFVPWLCNNYKNVYVIDPRKLTVNLSEFVQKNKIQEVIFLNYMFIPTNQTYMTALDSMI